MVARSSIGGSRVRIHLSNVFGAAPLAVDTGQMPVPVGNFGEGACRGHDPQAGRRGAGRGLAEPPNQLVPTAPSLGTGHLLFEDRRHQGLENLTAAAQPKAWNAASGIPQDAWGKGEP